ncbi:MAG: YCF48-related protein [Candidatus Falkowbacteria bacterium]|nr:YCF48-related protein [Candidatus Falkowbacteria bacterium]
MKKLIIILVGLFLYSSVYAMNWVPLNLGTTSNVKKVVFINTTTGYAICSPGAIVKTTNAGASWTTLFTSSTEGLFGITFVDANTGYAVGTSGLMLKTTNAGANWTISYPGSDQLFDIYFLNAQTGWIVGDFSTCLKTTNSGVNWTMQQVPLSNGLLVSVTFNNGKGFIGVSISGTNLLTTTNGGTNWVDNKIRAGGISSLDISFVGNFGVTVGSENLVNNVVRPLIFMTSNNGQNWVEHLVADKKAFLASVDICQSNPNIVFAVGNYYNDSVNGNKGLIMHSTNGGVSWISEVWNSNQILTGVTTTSTDVYIVGDGGFIYKAALPVGINQIGSTVPDKYILSQNYPNPFNPVTNIEFSIPKNGAVKLTVFDISGKEVAILVNQVLSIGKYKVDYNASNLSSGTYFYRLQANDFVSTKKMVLIK